MFPLHHIAEILRARVSHISLIIRAKRFPLRSKA